MQYGLLMPGQGAQEVGMGKDFAAASAAARRLYARADETLGLPLTQICFEGPIERLTATDVAQPAIYVTSLAALAALAEAAGRPLQPALAAGLSLGEYTALAAAGVFSFEDGLRLVRARGRAMQAASAALPSGMSSVLGLDEAGCAAACAAAAAATGKICQVANLNAPGQIVVSGETAALEAFEGLAKAAGARRVLRLQVAGAFHSEVMRPAARELDAALAAVEFRRATCPVWQNATARPAQEPAELRANLSAQLCAPVRWEESFRGMAGAAPAAGFLEPAPGRVLAGLARKIAPEAAVASLHEAAALPTLLARTA